MPHSRKEWITIAVVDVGHCSSSPMSPLSTLTVVDVSHHHGCRCGRRHQRRPLLRPSPPSTLAIVTAVAIVNVNAGTVTGVALIEPKILCLRQSLPPQPYALEVSNQVLQGLAIASRQPRRGGEARGRGGRHSSTRDTLSSSALAAGRSMHHHGCCCGRRCQRRP